MSTLLISMLGGAAEGEERRGHQAARFRLPGGERIVETSHLGIELARALQCDKLHLVGTPGAYFDRLLDLLPNSECEAPVKETAPLIQEPKPADEAPPGPDNDADASAPAEGEAPAPEAEAEQPEATPEPGAEAEQLAEPEATPEPEAEAEQPEATAEPAAEAAQPAEPEATPEPAASSVPIKHHEPDLRSLSDRILSQVQSRRPDRDAMSALAERLQAALGIAEVHCEFISNPTEGRSFMAAVRSIAELPKDGDTVHMDVTYGSRSFPMLGVISMAYFREFRPDVTVGHVYEGSEESMSRERVCSVVTLDGPMEFMHWMSSFRDVRDGRAPHSLQDFLNQDRHLQRMAGPYVRFQRGVQFGAMSEIVEGARLIEERRRRLNRLPYAHPYRLFDGVLARALKPFLGEGTVSTRQYLLAQQAFHAGHIPHASLHLREALVSSCLEAYKRNPTRAWIDVPQSGGAQQVRPRDVAGYILSTPAAISRAPTLATVWPLLATARNRYVNTSPTTVPASHLKDQDHEVRRSIELAGVVIRENQLDGLMEDVVWEDAVKQGIDLRVIRTREGRRPQRGAGRKGEGGGEGRPPRRDRGNRPPRRDTRDGGRGGDARGGGGRGGGGPRRSRHDGDRPPRRDPGGGGRPDPADSTPRVTTSRGGLGNFGKALASAGIGDEPPEAAPEQPPVIDAAPEPNPSPAPEPAPEPNPSPAPEPAPEPDPSPAPEPAEQPKTEDPEFDVAGPGDPPKNEE
ncbi:MAG: hypothetical protein HRU14_14885 [Planctomycetes bacterium]|nr:hypothetical protein [Planctomycetota bacterium]